MNLLRKLIRQFRVKRYTYNLRRLYLRLDDIRIDRPIFVLGVQGGGLTIIMKALQRHSKTCFCLGNSDHWDAADNEMHAYLTDPLLPKRFSFVNNPVHHPKYRTNHWRYWTYALDDTIGMYRIAPDSLKAEEARRFRKVIKKAIRAYAHDPNDCRFVDKSQLYTINIAAIQKVLDKARPFFAVITRNPYAMVKRVTERYYENPNRLDFSFSHEESLSFCCQHWRNTYSWALKDGRCVENFALFSFEDFLSDPASLLKSLCVFADLNFNPNIVPAPDQDRTPYAMMPSRWYPIRQNVNQKYLDRLTRREISVIERECGDLALQLGYAPPGDG